MLYLEELLDVTMAEEGQLLMGLDFLFDALNMPMQKIDLLFRKAVSEYSERRPMKKASIINTNELPTNGDYAFLKMPEGTTSCRVARYGLLSQIPRFYLPKLPEQNVEFDPATLMCKVWPPLNGVLQLTYTQKYIPTTNKVIEGTIVNSYSTDEVSITLPTMYASKTLTFQKAIVEVDEVTGEETTKILTMSPTGSVSTDEITGEKEAYLEGSLGIGTVNLITREVNLQLLNSEPGTIVYNYYPKYSVVEELDIGHYVLTKIFASKLLRAMAALKSQATQSNLHQLDISTDDLITRSRELAQEIREISKSTLSFGSLAPM